MTRRKSASDYRRADSDKLTPSSTYDLSEAKTLQGSRQFALGARQHGSKSQASDATDRSVGRRGHRRREAHSMGCRPFVTAVNDLLRETAPYYAQSTQDERRRKLRRIYRLLVDLKSQGKIETTSPKKLTERDLSEIIGWFKGNLDATTAAHYMKFLDEVLQSVGNNVISRLKVKRRHLLPKPMVKSISLIPSDSMDILLSGGYKLDDPWWDAASKAAIALCAHTGLRSSELRLSRLADLNLDRMEMRVSSPKGMARWTNGTERAPIMPGCEEVMRDYLERRRIALAEIGQTDVEALFPFISVKGEARFWSAAMWAKLKQAVETASGEHFRWKDFRPTYAQTLKDANAPIEAISKCLRHSSTKTTEQYYGRIRAESAFSQVRAAWQARKPLSQEIPIPAD